MGNLDALRAHYRGDNTAEGADTPPAQSDADLDAMKSEAPLLALIRADTCEQGRESGKHIHFHTCPVCGHKDDFTYYPEQNTWACMSASNTTGITGGSYVDYLLATRKAADKKEAVRMLREATGHPLDAASAAEAPDEPQGRRGATLPPWVPVQAADPPKRSPALVGGLLRRGHVSLLAGKGKSCKSWAAIALAVAVATGGDWLGFSCERGRVLYLDPEIDPKSLDNRFAEVCRARGADPAEVQASVCKWPLRGVEGAGMSAIVAALREGCCYGEFALVILDSCSVFVEGDENSSVFVRSFFARVNELAAVTGASVLLVHHFGKGDAGDRDAGDRARGSSVWLDAPDATLYMTEVFPPSEEASIEGVRAFALETGGLREFPPMDARHLLFEFPLHRLDAEGITDDWKPRSGQRAGGKSTAELNRAKAEANRAGIVSKVLAHYYAENVGADGLLVPEVAKAVGCDARQIAAAVDGCEFLYLDEKSSRKRYVRPTRPPRKLEFLGEAD